MIAEAEVSRSSATSVVDDSNAGNAIADERGRGALRIVEAALLLGVMGDLLLGRAQGLGVNLLMWISLIAAAVWWLERARGARVVSPFARRWLVPSLFVFAALIAWRASVMLRALDLIIVALLVALVLAETRAPSSVARAGVVRMMVDAIRGWSRILIGFVPLICADVRWREIGKSSRWSQHATGVLRGLIIGLPLVLFFGALFMAADAVFSRLVVDAFAFDSAYLVRRVLLTLFFVWLAGGLLRSLLFGARAVASVAASGNLNEENQKIAATLKVGVVETGIVLGSLNALFALFVAVQLRYLFGGAERVAATAGLTYAEYARRGFFELVIVAAITLSLVLGWHALLRRGEARAEQVFRLLAGLLVALLFVIMASAVMRMTLYTQEYGLTELRLYTTAFMLWLATTLVWFVATVVWRGERRRFACGALALGLVVTFGLHVANPDALIVRVNAARVGGGRVFDAEYALSLSDDAIPALAAALPRLPTSERAAVARGLIARGEANADVDWRAWTIAGARVRSASKKYEELWRADAIWWSDERRNDGGYLIPAE